MVTPMTLTWLLRQILNFQIGSLSLQFINSKTVLIESRIKHPLMKYELNISKLTKLTIIKDSSISFVIIMDCEWNELGEG